MPENVLFNFSFEGSDADQHALDLYDVSQALIGFQRSLALTTHLAINGEIITQAPSLKGADIYALPPEAGSWQVKALIVLGATGLYNLGTTQNNSPLGHIVFSLYDYVVSKSLGVHVDYNKSLGKLYEEAQQKKIKVKPVTSTQAEALIEKCDTAIREMHRPIYMSQTAESATITCALDGWDEPIHTTLSLATYDFIHQTQVSDTPEQVIGKISSYNINTFKGRIYVPMFGRPVSFELSPKARTTKAIAAITNSLHQNASSARELAGSTVYAKVLRNTSKTGHLRRLTVLSISNEPPEDA